MIVRNCSGGVVFNENKVFILKNDKNQWVLPKGKIRGSLLATETAINRVKYETGVRAKVISAAGETSYEFFSLSRKQEVYNKIIWYVMEALNDNYNVNEVEGFKDGGFYEVDKAIDMITHNQEKSLVSLSYKKYKEFKEYKINNAHA